MEYARAELVKRAFRISQRPLLLPQAWSDNVVMYWNSLRDAQFGLVALSKALWDVARCSLKKGSLAIVQASVVRYPRSDVCFKALDMRLEFQEPLLGTILCANGSNVSQRSRLIGCLRGAYVRNANILSNARLSSVHAGSGSSSQMVLLTFSCQLCAPTSRT